MVGELGSFGLALKEPILNQVYPIELFYRYYGQPYLFLINHIEKTFRKLLKVNITRHIY
jgi:hypothetical protein